MHDFVYCESPLSIDKSSLSPKGPRVFLLKIEGKPNSAKLEPILVYPTIRSCS
jgi:hypothetical protein